MDPNSRQVTVQRKATIVKVTEQRMVSGPVSGIQNAKTPPVSQALDTVVQRRKATIIKVTEHRERYTPRNPEFRHSYTEGLYKENSMQSQGNHSQHNACPSYPQLASAKTPDTSAQELEKNGGTLHRSTLNLFVSNPPAVATPAPSELPLRAVGQRSERPQRPQSCYGNVFGHSAASEDDVTKPVARKWSFGLPLETKINPANSGGGFISSQTAGIEAGQLEAETFKPNGSEKDERLPPENAGRRASPCLTLIKAPDPGSNQSPEEVLALNAAAIIANIKLQRQLSKKKTQNGSSEKDTTASASPQGNTVTDEGTCMEPNPDQSPVQHQSQPHAAFVPLSQESKRSTETISLQEALQRSRPDFISRSQGRMRELERRAQERKELAKTRGPQSDAARRQRRSPSARFSSLNDNLSKPRDRAITGKEMQPRSKRLPVEVKRKKEEEKKREVVLSNKQRVELFKKKLLDQILHRKSS
ncbi:(E2-independent) E3 ubiquitin-conjugating enzyme FATS [Cheilinus undulatus]|uniref:(E2-independent) E3 ubiquitin-conjugating enzyme FATS n=1 Tax=Cheilinus undulatus TaxID=241271 RepID=UPI001BD6BF71|nr:(E2-independent) E3 ubiquitin-conjugating enzyme FATS [Cheilinus undulatus]